MILDLLPLESTVATILSLSSVTFLIVIVVPGAPDNFPAKAESTSLIVSLNETPVSIFWLSKSSTDKPSGLNSVGPPAVATIPPKAVSTKVGAPTKFAVASTSKIPPSVADGVSVPDDEASACTAEVKSAVVTVNANVSDATIDITLSAVALTKVNTIELDATIGRPGVKLAVGVSTIRTSVYEAIDPGFCGSKKALGANVPLEYAMKMADNPPTTLFLSVAFK